MKPILTREVLQPEFYQGSSLLSAPKGRHCPLALDGCRTAGINASDTKLITPTEIHTLDGQETMGPG